MDELKSGFELTFMCPQCKQNAVVDDDTYTDTIKDIKTGDFMVCTNCGAGYLAEIREPFHSVQLLNIEEHEFDNEEAIPPQSTTPEEDEPAFDNVSISEIEPDFEEDVALPTGIDNPRNKDMSFEEYVESFGLGTADMTDEDYDMWEKQYQEYINSATEITGESKMKYSTLVDKLTKITKDYLINEGGFPENDVVEYFTVDVSPSSSDDYMSVQVRAELDFDEMNKLARELNKIVKSIDNDAYFDFDAPGIMTAYVPMRSITSSQKVDASLANYGGAFDIDPYSFFTREELNEFGYDVAEAATDIAKGQGYDVVFNFQDIYLEEDYRTIVAEFTDLDYEYQLKQKIDMRAVRNPNDLNARYCGILANALVDEYIENINY